MPKSRAPDSRCRCHVKLAFGGVFATLECAVWSNCSVLRSISSAAGDGEQLLLDLLDATR